MNESSGQVSPFRYRVDIGRIAELVSGQHLAVEKEAGKSGDQSTPLEVDPHPAGVGCGKRPPALSQLRPQFSRGPGAKTMPCRSPCFFELHFAQSSRTVQYGETPDSG